MSTGNSGPNDYDTLFQMIKTRYGERLEPDELEEVRKGVEGMADLADALRASPLEYGDEPFAVFLPYRRQEE